MKERERLIDLIENAEIEEHIAVGDDDRLRLADYLFENGVVVLPCKVGDMVDEIFSHNEIVSLWIDDGKGYESKQLWEGMAWAIPEKYKNMIFKRVFGTIPETIYQADTINILVEQALKGGNKK